MNPSRRGLLHRRGRLHHWGLLRGRARRILDVAGFDAFMQRYVAALPVERAAVEHVGIGHRRAGPQTGTTSATETEEQPA